jgi:hypothetical protein
MQKFTSFAHHAHSLALIITLAEQLARSLIAPTHTQRSLITHTAASQKRAAPASTCQHHDVDTTRPGMRCRGKADPSAGLPPPLHASTSMLQYRQCSAVERPFLWGQSDERVATREKATRESTERKRRERGRSDPASAVSAVTLTPVSSDRQDFDQERDFKACPNRAARDKLSLLVDPSPSSCQLLSPDKERDRQFVSSGAVSAALK